MALSVTDYTYEQQGSFIGRRPVRRLPKGRGSEFAVFQNPPLTSWPTETVQSPARQLQKRAAAIMRGDDGVELPKINWLNTGSEVQPPQPPHSPRIHRSAGILPPKDGNDLPFQRFFPAGFEVQNVQPPNPATTNISLNNRRAAALVGGHDPGNQFTQVGFLPYGWPIQPVQPPNPNGGNLAKNNTKFAATVGGIESIEGVYTFVPLALSPWQEMQPLVARPRWPRGAALYEGDDGTEAAFVPPTPFVSMWGFDAPLQPPRPGIRQRYVGIKGRAQFAIFAPFCPFGFEVQPPIVRFTRTLAQRASAAGGDSQFVSFDMSAWWENHSWSPQPKRRINLAFVESGNENQTTPPVVVTSGWGFDPLPVTAKRITRRDVSYVENIEPPSPGVFYPHGWPIQSVQPPHPAWERRFGAFAPLSNIEAVFVPPVALTTGWGFDAQPWQPPYRRVRNVVTPFTIDSPLVNFFPFGWEVQSVQPNHPAPEKRFGAVAPWSNVEAVFVPPLPVPFAFWQTDYPQPQHPRRERAGAIMPFPSIESVFVFTPPPAPTMWESYCPQPPHPRPEQRAAGIMPLANVEGPLVRFQPFGWHVPSPEPHPRWEKAGAIVPPLALVEPPFVGFTPFWMMAPAHPEPHPRREKFGSIVPPLAMLVEPPFQAFYPTAWNVYPQPPHPRAERGAALLPTDFESPFVNLFIELDPNYVARSPYHFYTAASSWWHNVAQANDLNPPIDAGVAIRTATFDFGDELTDGVKITSVVSLTCEVYQSISDTITDPTPAARLIGTYQLSTSPNSGQPLQAVSQLIGTMVGGVTYRLECVVTTSDGQQPSVWTHVYCQTPN